MMADEAPRLSRLELLPLELQHQIFIASENVDITYVSRTLCRNFSVEHVYRRIARATFDHLICTLPEAPPIDRIKNIKERSKYQKVHFMLLLRLLNCHWMTYKLFWSFAHTPMPNYLECITFCEGFSFPKRLLRGPWTDDKIRLLELLRSNASDLCADLSDASGQGGHEVQIVQGLTEAVIEQNHRALECLLSMTASKRYEVSEWDLDLADLAMTMPPYNELLELAVVKAGCYRPVVRLIFNAWYAALEQYHPFNHRNINNEEYRSAEEMQIFALKCQYLIRVLKEQGNHSAADWLRDGWRQIMRDAEHHDLGNIEEWTDSGLKAGRQARLWAVDLSRRQYCRIPPQASLPTPSQMSL